MPEMYQYMKSAGHKQLYARDVLTLNEAAMAKVSQLHIIRNAQQLPLASSAVPADLIAAAQVGGLCS